MKILAILACLCFAHLTSGRTTQTITHDIIGLGGDLDDQNTFHTANVRAKNINNRNPFNDDDQTVNVFKICKRQDINDLTDHIKDDVRNVFDFHNKDTINLNVRDDEHKNDCVVLQIKGRKKTTNHVVVVAVKDNDPDQDLRNNQLNNGNVVFVTINKKLGSYTRQDINDDDIVGKADFKDTIGALKWIRKNIHKFGGDRDQMILAVDQNTVGIANELKNNQQTVHLIKQVIVQTNDNTNTIKDQIKKDIANQVGCHNINRDDIDKCLKLTMKSKLDDAKARVKQNYGGDLNYHTFGDRNRLFNNDDLFNKNNRFRNYDTIAGGVNNIRFGNDDLFNKNNLFHNYDNIDRVGRFNIDDRFNNRNYDTINDVRNGRFDIDNRFNKHNNYIQNYDDIVDIRNGRFTNDGRDVYHTDIYNRKDQFLNVLNKQDRFRDVTNDWDLTNNLRNKFNQNRNIYGRNDNQLDNLNDDFKYNDRHDLKTDRFGNFNNVRNDFGRQGIDRGFGQQNKFDDVNKTFYKLKDFRCRQFGDC